MQKYMEASLQFQHNHLCKDNKDAKAIMKPLLDIMSFVYGGGHLNCY